MDCEAADYSLADVPIGVNDVNIHTTAILVADSRLEGQEERADVLT
jgi:hypothetical protein